MLVSSILLFALQQGPPPGVGRVYSGNFSGYRDYVGSDTDVPGFTEATYGLYVTSNNDILAILYKHEAVFRSGDYVYNTISVRPNDYGYFMGHSRADSSIGGLGVIFDSNYPHRIKGLSYFRNAQPLNTQFLFGANSSDGGPQDVTVGTVNDPNFRDIYVPEITGVKYYYLAPLSSVDFSGTYKDLNYTVKVEQTGTKLTGEFKTAKGRLLFTGYHQGPKAGSFLFTDPVTMNAVRGYMTMYWLPSAQDIQDLRQSQVHGPKELKIFVSLDITRGNDEVVLPRE